MRIAFALCRGCVLMGSAWLAPATAQDEPRHFLCSFSAGTSWSYDGGSFKTQAPASLSFEITDIDLDGQSARLVTDGRDKPGALKIVRAINANHFLEVMNEGFLNLTTIYDKDAATGTYPAVHSRHFGLIGQPVFAQYAGTCQAK